VESKTIQSEGLDGRFEDSPVEVGVPQNRSVGGGEDHPLWVPGYATEFEVSGKALTEEADEYTVWPEGFDPVAAGVIFED
jgi:hypothetical protein